MFIYIFFFLQIFWLIGRNLSANAYCLCALNSQLSVQLRENAKFELECILYDEQHNKLLRKKMSSLCYFRMTAPYSTSLLCVSNNAVHSDWKREVDSTWTHTNTHTSEIRVQIPFCSEFARKWTKSLNNLSLHFQRTFLCMMLNIYFNIIFLYGMFLSIQFISMCWPKFNSLSHFWRPYADACMHRQVRRRLLSSNLFQIICWPFFSQTKTRNCGEDSGKEANAS